MCEPDDVNQNDKLMKTVIVHDGIKPLHHYLYMFPPAPKFDLDEVGEPVHLTPFIKQGRLLEARAKAKVQGMPWQNLISFAGFLTVNQKYNSNLYFWFFPSQSDPENDPVILWLQGGPGATSLYGLFKENGPIHATAIDERDATEAWETMYKHGKKYPFPEYKRTTPRATLNPYSWNRNASVIYIDNPVGAGFSYTDDPKGYPRFVNESTVDLYEGLQQFFRLFPEFAPK